MSSYRHGWNGGAPPLHRPLSPAGGEADRQVTDGLGSDNLIQAINGLTQLVWGDNSDLLANPLNGERSNLACLHP